ncbi:2-oxo acid dehydrogenase subunit E2 [Synechococcus sp. Lug-A]|uniref:dihydrolipoamide acetyltransferase family protein n=1 Tax=Synechococcus sp. Lug-A TaxID=2823740 RepID=UPI0020CED34C|nr:dihydrolipoamide acetyltransferase family protein [Synechococcus sp. Lug-A]MCP9846674.1 2-oxo acid dehydrogenase subunit E2 [Synechococcus sp. Lug-A]
MATYEIFMPALSSTMTEGKIVEWLKQPGDRVERGESVLVVESDKADMDVEAFQEGFLAAVLMQAGGTAPVGETIGLIVETEAEIAAAQAGAPSAPAAAPAPVAAPASPSPVAAPVAPAAPVAVAPPAPAAVAAASLPVAAAPAAGNGRVVATPRARKLASQLGVKLEALKGSGPHGRIQAEDVERAAGQPASVARVAEGSAPVTAAAPAGASAGGGASAAPAGQSFGRPGETVAFTTLQGAVNRNMLASLAVPCFHVGYTITTDRLDAFYKQVKSKGVTMTALLAKAVGVVLARHPQVNAAASETGMVYPASVNVAIAVAMDDGGLVTPVLKEADRTDLYSLSRSWADLVARSRTKQLKPDEYSTGTFTLSNLGMFGVDRFDAILPPGTGAILAVAASRPTVVANADGSIAVKRQMQVNLTADHRVIYGAHGAAFLKDLADLIEHRPESLAL